MWQACVNAFFCGGCAYIFSSFCCLYAHVILEKTLLFRLLNIEAQYSSGSAAVSVMDKPRTNRGQSVDFAKRIKTSRLYAPRGGKSFSDFSGRFELQNRPKSKPRTFTLGLLYQFLNLCISILFITFAAERYESMFEEICSIYADALDNVGRYVDMETGECIQQMSVREFCLTDRWKPYVERLRAMRAEYGAAAKKMPEYVNTKKMLPGATLSGLFATWPDECVRKDGTKFTAPVSRRETHLQRHTGWLAIDIDLADNEQLSDFENVRMVCRFRPEIALLMRSCSGAGYFGLVRLAYPDRHKEQFKALLRDYAAIGITLDKQCGNIGRVRFASWDNPEDIYINEQACVYAGVMSEAAIPLRERHAGGYSYADSQPSASDFWGNPRVQDRLIEVIVKAMVSGGVNITEDYEEWCKAGWALKAHPYGEQLYHELSRCSGKYNPATTAHKWKQLGVSHTVTGNYLIHACKMTLGEGRYRELCRQVWNELK